MIYVAMFDPVLVAETIHDLCLLTISGNLVSAEEIRGVFDAI